MLTILHGADLHLDSPFSSLPPELGQQLRKLQRQLPGLLVELARQRGCQLILLAGDIFDGPGAAPETVDALREALGRFPGPVCIAPGNHDFYTPGGLWDRTLWPENVHIFTGTPSSVALRSLGCRVWGGAFRGPDCFEPLPTAPRENLLQVGVFHGDPLNPGPYRYLSGESLDACGLDYLALGHIHVPLLPRRRGRTWYGWPGVAMGRGFDECGPHGVFVTTLDGSSCRAELCPLGDIRFETMEISRNQLPALPPDSRHMLCRMTLTGERQDTRPSLDALRQRLEGSFLYLDLRDGTTPRRQLWSACGDGTLRGLALDHLQQANGDRELAARYLLAALEGGDEPCD